MKKLFVLVLFLMLSACCTQRFEFSNQQSSSIPNYEGNNHFIFWGLGQTQVNTAEDVCGTRGVAAVETNTSFLNGLFSTITYGIYQPESFSVYCNRIN